MRYHDLTRMIEPAMPVYPDTDPPRFRVGASIEEQGFLEHEIVMFTHTGTHMDAPAHLIAGGKTLDEYPVDAFVGPACVVDARGVDGGTIGVEALGPYRARIEAADFVLFDTGWHSLWDSPGYFDGFPTLTPEAAQWLVDLGIKGVGVDAISVDPVGVSEMRVHNVLLGAEVLIIENLGSLDALIGEDFAFSCYPLRFRHADGSPVRAVAAVG